jgi:hypothetical protein
MGPPSHAAITKVDAVESLAAIALPIVAQRTCIFLSVAERAPA